MEKYPFVISYNTFHRRRLIKVGSIKLIRKVQIEREQDKEEDEVVLQMWLWCPVTNVNEKSE